MCLLFAVFASLACHPAMTGGVSKCYTTIVSFCSRRWLLATLGRAMTPADMSIAGAPLIGTDEATLLNEWQRSCMRSQPLPAT